MSEFLSTAIEAVRHAGAMQMARFGQGLRIDKKGAIDLVTDVDVAVEAWFRAFIHERFPDHRILAEELPSGRCSLGGRLMTERVDRCYRSFRATTVVAAYQGMWHPACRCVLRWLTDPQRTNRERGSVRVSDARHRPLTSLRASQRAIA